MAVSTPPPAVDDAKLEAFMGKLMGDLGGMMATMMAAIGDRLGLFKDLALKGPATSRELAERTGIDGRYALEWLRAMASAGYLEYDPGSERFRRSRRSRSRPKRVPSSSGAPTRCCPRYSGRSTS